MVSHRLASVEKREKSVRVIAGSARGVPLISPEGNALRPTLDRVRENLFNILQPWFPGARFLDLFAGSGAIGIEALSRGAEAATFVEGDARAMGLVRRNLEKTRLAKHAMCLQLHLPDQLARVPGQYDVVFADPPYDMADLEGLLTAIGEQGLLGADGVLVLEHAQKRSVPEVVGPLRRTREKKYGETRLSFYA